MDRSESTITAISTPAGAGAISIVRLSGDQALPLLSAIFVPKNKKQVASHTVKYGHIVHDDRVIDEVMVSFFLAPHTYTREDIVEINCHGGELTAQVIVNLLITLGAILAEPGEFTKRAFLNGRIDLTQAEAVMDMINASTQVSRDMSMNLLTGGLSEKINSLRTSLLSAIAALEVAIDYPEEDYFTGYDEILEIMTHVEQAILSLINKSKHFEVMKNGISTAIVGRPNVGKSSLLNFLSKEDRAIVTAIAGTTRDVITAPIHLGHLPIKLIDTAGLRETTDVVEQMGQERTKQAVEQAQLVLVIVDISQEVTSADVHIIESIKGNKIIVANKSDLMPVGHVEQLEAYGKVVQVSAVTGAGITELEKAIMAMYPNIDVSGQLAMANARQLVCLQNSLDFLALATTSIQNRASEEFVSLDLTNAYGELGYILGEEMDEGIIDQIFSAFCLGK